MDVQDVQAFFFTNFEHFYRERKCIRRMVEEGILDNLGLMEMDAWVVRVHPDGRGVGDEMNIVSARGKFLTKFGGDDTRTAIGGIPCDTNAHV